MNLISLKIDDIVLLLNKRRKSEKGKTRRMPGGLRSAKRRERVARPVLPIQLRVFPQFVLVLQVQVVVEVLGPVALGWRLPYLIVR